MSFPRISLLLQLKTADLFPLREDVARARGWCLLMNIVGHRITHS